MLNQIGLCITGLQLSLLVRLSLSVSLYVSLLVSLLYLIPDYDEPEEDEDVEGLVNDFEDKQTCAVTNKYLLAFLAHTDLTS